MKNGIDIPSYLFGKNSVVIPEPPAPEPPKLQDKAVTIIENTTTNIQADEGYDGLQLVTVETEVPSSDSPFEFDFSKGTGSLAQSVVEVNSIDIGERTTLRNFFSYCFYIESVPLFDTSNVTDMQLMFTDCNNLSEVPLFDTSKVTDMTSMFQRCGSLTAVPLFNTSKVTTMLGMFSSCTSLTSVPLFDTSIVTTTQNMFGSCTSLTEAPSFVFTDKLGTISYMFKGCTNLTTIPQYYVSKVTNMKQPFANCPSLSNTSLNNILGMCANATSYNSTKTLAYIGLSSTQATTCTTLSNWAAASAAGWTTGY